MKELVFELELVAVDKLLRCFILNYNHNIIKYLKYLS